jgi:hypothetical protein
MAAGVFALLGALSDDFGEDGLVLLAPLALVTVVLVSWALAPRGFAIEASQLVVERPLLPVRIPLASVRAVELFPPGATRGALRIAGTSGLFGNYGRFWSRSLGFFRLYATRREGLVRVETEGAVFVLSPDPPERFVEALLGRAPRAQRSLGAVSGKPAPRAFWWPLAAAAALVPLLVGGALARVWALAPRSASVTGDAVRIERRWASPRDIPLASVRTVERLAPPSCGRWWKVNGTAGAFGVAYGTFRSKALGRFQLYAWRPDNCVLLETSEGRVVLTPDDPERFAAEVRARIGR